VLFALALTLPCVSVTKDTNTKIDMNFVFDREDIIIPPLLIFFAFQHRQNKNALFFRRAFRGLEAFEIV